MRSAFLILISLASFCLLQREANVKWSQRVCKWDHFEALIGWQYVVWINYNLPKNCPKQQDCFWITDLWPGFATFVIMIDHEHFATACGQFFADLMKELQCLAGLIVCTPVCHVSVWSIIPCYNDVLKPFRRFTFSRSFVLLTRNNNKKETFAFISFFLFFNLYFVWSAFWCLFAFWSLWELYLTLTNVTFHFIVFFFLVLTF